MDRAASDVRDKTKPRTIRRILSSPEQIRALGNSNHRKRKKVVTLSNFCIDALLRNWVYYVWQNNVTVTDHLILAKGVRLCNEWYKRGTGHRRYGTKFSRGCLVGFKKCHGLKFRRSHGEAGDPDHSAAAAEIPILHELITQYGEENVFNADELALRWR